MTTQNTSALPADVSASDSSPAGSDHHDTEKPVSNGAEAAAVDESRESAESAETMPKPQDKPAEESASARPSQEAEAASPLAAAQAPGSPAEGAAAAQNQAASEGQAPPDQGGSSPSEAAPAPSEKTRRRVQLSPTVSPEVARPVPSIASPTPPGAMTPPATVESSAAPAQSPAAPKNEEATEESATAASDAETQEADAEASAPPPAAAEPVELPPKDEQLDEDIESQLNAALSSDEADASATEAKALAAAANAEAAPGDAEVKRGARLSGNVQSIHGDDMFIEFGLRMPGVLSRRQFGLRRQPMQGESITVIVNRIDEKEGLIYVNLPSGASRVRGNWEELSVDQTVEVQVNATNKGGLEVSVGSLRGFMPASQVELGYVADLNTYVGQKLRAQITEVNPKRRKLVLSRRRILEAEREHTEQEVFQKIAPGQTYEGRVKTIKDYGAFVDIGGVDGLLHVGQISWSRINHPSDVLTEGQQIEVKVLSVDPEKKKIGLGMRQLSQNPWKAAEQNYPSGSVTQGKVTRIEGFGAFIELEPGIEGLVHISELEHQRIKTVHEVLKVGQEVNVQVLEVDPSRKRISLSVKALKEKPEDVREAEQEAAPIRRQDPESLKGGIGEPTGGKLFGDPRSFGR